MSPRGATFELERFAVSPITADVVLLEIEGRLAGAPGRSAAPRLLVERAGGARPEHVPVEATADDGLLRASFAVPAGDVEAARLALAVGGLLLDLPAPDIAEGRERTAALAGEVGLLRRELTELRREVAAGRDASAGHAAERERTERAAAEHEAAADRAAADRVAEVEHAAAERVAEAERVATDQVAAAERAASELARREQAARAELEALRAALAQRGADPTESAPGPRTRAAPVPEEIAGRSVTIAGAPAGVQTTTEAEGPTVAPGPGDDPTAPHPLPAPETEEHPVADDAAEPLPAAITAAGRAPRQDATEAVAPPEETGPIPLRRVRRVVTAPEEAARAVGPAAGLPAAPDAEPGLPSGPSTRTVALATLAVAALLVLVAILGFLL